MSVPSWHGGLKLARGMPIWHGTVPVPGTLVLGVSSDFETCVSFDKLGLANLELTLYNIRGQKS